MKCKGTKKISNLLRSLFADALSCAVNVSRRSVRPVENMVESPSEEIVFPGGGKADNFDFYKKTSFLQSQKKYVYLQM